MEGKNDEKNKSVWISISSSKEVEDYRKSLINVLDKVEIDNCNPEFREDLAKVYRLLSLLISADKSQSKEQIKEGEEFSDGLRKVMA